ncbi:MAG: anti-sigma factor [Planctomycetes bacterium]|nr:anti-sigma factor [Planctomycetota bacterium]
MTHAEFQDLCAAHALGALDGEERGALEAHLAECAACRRLVAENVEATAGLAAALKPIEPPTALRDRILVAARASTPRFTGPRAVIPSWAVPAAAAAALLVGVWFGAKLQEVSKGPSALQAELEKVRGDNAKLREEIETNRRTLAELQTKEVKFMADAAMGEMSGGIGAEAALGKVFWHKNEVHVMAAGLPMPPEGKGYQVWALVDGMKPMPGNVFTPNAAGAMAGAGEIVGIPQGKVVKFAVTVEPIAGVKEPTGAMIMTPMEKK